MKRYKTVLITNWDHKQWYKYDYKTCEETVYSIKDKNFEDLVNEMNDNGYFLSAIDSGNGIYYFTTEV